MAKTNEKDKAPGVGDIAITAIKEGKTNEEVLEIVQKAHPEGKTTMASINWYRGKLRGEGAKLKGSSKPIPTSRELKAKAKKVAEADAKKSNAAGDAPAKKSNAGGEDPLA